MITYVRSNGSDSTGTGAVDAPFATVAAAVAVSTEGDTLDIGEGTFQQTGAVNFTVPLNIRGVLGKTHVQFLGLGEAAWVFPSSLNAYQTPVTLAGLIFEPQASGWRGMLKVEGAPTGHMFICRCLFRYLGSENGVWVLDNKSGRVIILNTVHVSQLQTANRGNGIRHEAEDNAAEDQTIVLNSIFSRLETAIDDENARPILEDWNCFYENERDVKVGRPGLHSMFKDPQWMGEVNWDYRLQRTSPCIDAGLDIGALNIQTTTLGLRNPPPPVGDGKQKDGIAPPKGMNWQKSGSSLDIGMVEYLVPARTRTVNAIVTYTILNAFAREAQDIRAYFDQAKANQQIERASASALRARWGLLLGLERPETFTRNDYEDLITAIVRATQAAPTWRATLQVANAYMHTHALCYEYCKMPRFRLGNALKLYSRLAWDGYGGPTEVVLSPGEFQCQSRWYRTPVQRIRLSNTGIWHLFFLPTHPAFSNYGVPVLKAALTSREEALEDDMWFGMPEIIVSVHQGSTIVDASRQVATFQQTHPYQQLLLGVGVRRYVIKSVLSDTRIELTEPIEEPTQTIHARLGYPVVSLGKVVVSGGSISRIRTHSRLGQSAFIDSEMGRAHSVEVQLENTNDISTIFG